MKVTHLPKGFIDQILKAKNYKPELTYLKSQAKALGITFDKDASDDVINYQIIAKLKDVNTQAANDVLDTTKIEDKKYSRMHLTIQRNYQNGCMRTKEI